MGMEFRPYYFAREWVKMGHRVDIIAGDYSHLRRKNPEVAADFQKEVIEGINYYWIKTGNYEGNGVKRALTMMRFVGKLWLKAKWIAKEFKPDAIICSSTYPIDTFAGQRIRNYSRGLLIHEVHDMWPATLTEIGGMSPRNPFVKLMQIGENSAYRNSDYVVSILPNAEEYMREHGLKEGRFIHINNGIVVDDWNKSAMLPNSHVEILEKLKKEKYFIVGYFGGHALSNDLDTLLNVAKRMKSISDIRFVLVGDGVEKKHLQEKAEFEQIDNVIFLDPVSKYAIPQLTSYFDCSYIAAKESPLYRFGIAMNKIFDSMMAAKPMIYAVNAANNFAEDYHCGICAEAGDVDSIANAIEKLMTMPEEDRAAMGQNGRKAVLDNYEYKVLAKRFIDVMQRKEGI